MIGSRRRKTGVSLVLAALAALPILAFAGVPLITANSAYFVEMGATPHSVHWHWPLALIAVFFFVGIILIVFPARENAG